MPLQLVCYYPVAPLQSSLTPSHQRTTTLAAAACEYGIRVYTKTADKTVQEACNDTSKNQLDQAIKANYTSKSLKIFSHACPDNTLTDTVLQHRGWYPGPYAADIHDSATLTGSQVTCLSSAVSTAPCARLP